MTIAGQNAPANTIGLVAMSVPLQQPTAMGGFPGCEVYLDLGRTVVLAAVTAPSWTVPHAIPASPTFAGFEVTVQSVFAPTVGPLGYDLTNAARVRVGS